MDYMKKPSNFYQASDFYSKVREDLSKIRPREYALVSLDFDHFSVINHLFGYETGDAVLKMAETVFDGELGDGEYFSRLQGDHFVFWVRHDAGKPLAERFADLVEFNPSMESVVPEHYHFVCSGGIVPVEDQQENVTLLLDKADFARIRAKGNDTSTFFYYDEHIASEFRWRNIITLSMHKALEEFEFEMYLQPKVLIKTGQVVGAEALARWNSKKHGMIYPDQFIPVLEQSGFIEELDFFMLEQACRFIKKNMNDGKELLPISVNFSKAHLVRKNFVETIFQTVNRNGIPAGLIEIEMTESMMSDDFQTLINLANEFKYLGFKVALDDFGSAYSSLNYLKEMPFDVIKIDKEFLNSTTTSDKGRVIVAKMVELIKTIRMIPVMEGVETKEQADFLEKLGCDLGQGYYYSKPLPVSEYETYIATHAVLSDERFMKRMEDLTELSYSYVVPKEFQMDNWELYTLGKNIDMGLMKGYLDGEAAVQYVNDRALEYLGYSRQEFREQFRNSIAAFTYSEDVHSVMDQVQQLIETGKSLEFQSRAIRKDGKIIILKGRISCVIDNNGRPVGIYAFQDVTEELERAERMQHALEERVQELNERVRSEKESREALRLSEERYRLILEQSDDIMFEWNFETDAITFSEKFEKLFKRPPQQDHVTTNEEVRRAICPEDCEIFEAWVEATYQKAGKNKAEYRIEDGDGNYIWMRISSTTICDDCGVPMKAIGVFSDISKQKAEMSSLLRKAQLDPLTQLLNKKELEQRIEDYLFSNSGQSGSFLIFDIDNFKGLNDNLGHQFGDTVLQDVAGKIKTVFRESDILGRLGGDEIAIFLCNIGNPDVVQAKAEMLLELLHTTYFGETKQYSTSISIGIATYPIHGSTFSELYRKADAALYESKRKGKNCYTVYNEYLTESVTENRTPFYSSERFLNTYFAGDFPFSVFEMLYETKDMNTTLNMILEQLGKKFKVDRVYIFKCNDHMGNANNCYEWCAPGVTSERARLLKVPDDILTKFLDRFNAEGILYCSDTMTLEPEVFHFLDTQKIKSMLCCAICKDGKNMGFIGFDDCKGTREWRGDEIALLGYLSRILSVFMLQNMTMQKLLESYKIHKEMLENLNGFVYVIDIKNYELLYMNRAMRQFKAELGQKCHQVAFSSDTPCETCPIKMLSAEQPFATEEIYSSLIDGWVSSAASMMKWDGRKEAALICCTDISKYKK